MPQIALIVGAVASVAGTYKNYKANKDRSRLQQQQQRVNTRRSRMEAIRRAQLARAQAVASAAASGAQGSSTAIGGQSSVSSQTGTDFGFSTQMSGLSQGISDASSQAATWGAVANLGGSAFNFGLNQGATFQNTFSPNRPSQSGFSPSYSSWRPQNG